MSGRVLKIRTNVIESVREINFVDDFVLRKDSGSDCSLSFDTGK